MFNFSLKLTEKLIDAGVYDNGKIASLTMDKILLFDNLTAEEIGNIILYKKSLLNKETTSSTILTRYDADPKWKMKIDTMKIEELNLPVDIFNCLNRAHIINVGELMQMNDRELLHIRNLGRKAFEILKSTLEILKREEINK